MTTFQPAGYREERVIAVQADDAAPTNDPTDNPSSDVKNDPKKVSAATRAGQFLTFRLDLELRQRLKARLAHEGRSLSEVVIHGLRVYIQHGTSAAAPDKTTPDKTGQDKTAQDRTGQDKSATAPDEITAAQDKTAASAPHRIPGPTTAVASVADLVLPEKMAVYLRDLRSGGHSDLLSATLGKLHDAGWPLRPLAAALGISRQAVLARIRQQVPPEIRSHVPAVPTPSAFPRRRSAVPAGRRPHLTVKIDHALRSAAHHAAQREGSSLSQVIERILEQYLRHGLPPGEVRLGDTTPTRPAARRRRRTT
jgi:predicted HicB family RNase H-like nuclease